ncbi:MAG: homospermidine synthase [Hyphomicrobiaceae bacterium]
MSEHPKYHAHQGKIVMVGFGCVGQGVLPLLLRHIEMRPQQIRIFTAQKSGREVAEEFGIAYHAVALTRDNYRPLLEPLLAPGDFLLNLSVNVSSADLIALCHERGALYLDTCIEPWAGGYIDPTKSASQRSNYALREEVLALRRPDRKGPTAILTHGANPGLVSHFVKQALLNISTDTGRPVAAPKSREAWARLAQSLEIRVIHVAERDTQVAEPRKAPGEFCNTWSVDGFAGEGCQPAELGWGSHERHFPADGRRHEFGCKAAIYLARPGASTRVRTWTPLAGPIHGFLITHGESVSIADYLTIGAGDSPHYRPTVHYAYHPCDDAVMSVHELAGRNWHLQTNGRVFKDDIVAGIDELGVLLMGHSKGAYWYGSRLSIHEARRLCPHNSATSLQVTSGVMAGVIWAMRHPDRDVIDPDDMPYDEIMELCRPYLGEVTGAYSRWTPLTERGWLFPEDVDPGDPWQFKNFRVA